MLKSFKKILLKNKLLKESVWSLADKLSASLLGFLIFIIIPRLLGPEKYGLFSLTLSLVGFFVIFADLGLSSATSRFVAQYSRKDPSKLRVILKDTFELRLLYLGFVTFVFLVLIYPISAFLKRPELIGTLFVGIFIAPFWIITEHLKKLFLILVILVLEEHDIPLQFLQVVLYVKK